YPPTPHGGVPPGSPAVGRGSPDSAALQRSWGAGAPGLGPATTAHAPDSGERGEKSGQVQRPSVLLLACAVPTFPTLIRKFHANSTAPFAAQLVFSYRWTCAAALDQY